MCLCPSVFIYWLISKRSSFFDVISLFLWWTYPQVQQVWCVQRHWGKRASPIASSCAPWTDIRRMTGLNWVRFVHRPWPRKLRQNSLCQESYVTDCRGAALVSGAKTGALWGTAALHCNKDWKKVTCVQKETLNLKGFDFPLPWKAWKRFSLIGCFQLSKQRWPLDSLFIDELWCTNLLTFSP